MNRIKIFTAIVLIASSFVVTTQADNGKSDLVKPTLSADTNRPELSMFSQGEKVELTFKAAGLKPGEKETLSIDIQDAAEKSVKKLSLPVLADDKGNWQGKVVVPSERKGFFYIKAKLSCGVALPEIKAPGGHLPGGFITYGVVVDPAKRELYPWNETVFGMQGGFSSKVHVHPYLGVRWVMGPGAWNRNEPDYPGQFSDRRREAKAKGEQYPREPLTWVRYNDNGQEKRWHTYFFANQVGVVGLPNKWKTPPYRPETFDRGRGALSKEGEKHYAAYCQALAQAYAENYPDREKHVYELTWEPDLFWKGTPEDLVRYYEIASPIIKKHDPKARIMGPGAHAGGAHGVKYMEELFRAGLGKYIDLVSIHYSYIGEGFEHDKPAQRIRELKKLIRKTAGRDIPLVNTEFGMNTTFTHGPGLLRSAQQEIRAHLISLGEGFQHIIAFYVTDNGYFYNLNPRIHYGTDKTAPRPVAPAYAAMTWLLEGHRGAEAIEWMGGTAMGYAYENNDDVTLALWDYGDTPVEVTIPVGRETITVYDWMGNPTEVKTDRGALNVTLGNNPIYVQDVSPKIWGSKSVKPVNAAVSELDLCPGDTGEVSFTITANLGKAMDGTAVAQGADAVSIANPERTVKLNKGESRTLSFRVQVSPDASQGSYPLSLALRDGGLVVGAAGCVVNVRNPVKIDAIKPAFLPNGQKALKITLTETGGKAAKGTIKVRIKGVPESDAEVAFKLAPRQTHPVMLTFSDLAVSPLRRYELDAKVIMDSSYTFETTAKVNFLQATQLSKAPVIDGNPADWRDVPPVELKGVEHCLRKPVQYSGDSAQLRFAWDRTALYLFVQVTDDAFVQQYAGRRLWDGDALQIGLCLEPFKQFKATADAFADSFNRPAQTEINVALTPEGPMVFRELQFPESDHFKPGVLTPDKAPLAITRDVEGKLTYEMALPWKTLGLTKAPSAGEHIAVTVAVNDRDIEDQKKQWQPSALSLYEGATKEKDRELMGLLYLGE